MISEIQFAKQIQKNADILEEAAKDKDTDYLHGIRGKIPGAMTINAYEN